MRHKIPLQLLELEPHSYHLLTQVTINNSLSGLMIIDTGASRTVFDYQTLVKVVDNLQNMTDTVTSGINAMVTDCYSATIPNLVIDTFCNTNFETVLMDLQHIINLYQQFHPQPILGLIGSDFLIRHSAIIQYHKPCLILTTTNNKIDAAVANELEIP